MAYFPMMVNIEGADVLIVGGGGTAARKARQLVSFGARCHIIASEADDVLDELGCKVERRCYEDGDIERLMPLAMVIAATDDHALNHAIGERCAQLHIPVNIVDAPEQSDFIFASVVRDGDVVCAVASSGKSPLVSQYVKENIEKTWPEGIGEIADEMGHFRQELLASEPDITRRRALLKDRLRELLSLARTDADGAKKPPCG